MNFNNGNDNNNNKTNSYYVRAVRGGKCSLLSFESVHNAYMDCRKRKRGTVNAIRFEYNLISNLMALALELQKGTYRPSRSVCFITSSPKLREVFAANFRDRVVHHLIVRELEKTWEPCFIHDSFACRENRGTHEAVKRLQKFMIKASRNQKRRAFYIQLDVRSFFMSINKKILFEMLKTKTDEPVLLDLIARVLFHNPVENYLFRGDPGMIEKIPAHKTLFKTGPDKGLPIGNLTSQFFANVYLNALDQFVKHELRARFYVRYVDDFILVHESDTQLYEWEKSIEQFLNEKLRLSLRSEGILRPVSEGADFLGYIIRPGYMLSRKRVVNNLKYKLAIFHDNIVQTVKVRFRTVKRMTVLPEMITEIRQVLASYLGHFKHADTHKLILSIFNKNPWLNEIFILKKGKLIERLKYKGTFRSFRAQAAFFRSRFKNHILFFQIGKFIEVFDDDALLFNRIFGLQIREKTRKMKFAAGFPKHMENHFINLTLYCGYNAVQIREGGPGKFVKDRYVENILTL